MKTSHCTLRKEQKLNRVLKITYYGISIKRRKIKVSSKSWKLLILGLLPSFFTISLFPHWCGCSQYFHDSMSNMSHLPGVDQRVERWIEEDQRVSIKSKLYYHPTWSSAYVNNPVTCGWQVTNSKHKIYVECTNCGFSLPHSISHVSLIILC